MINWKNLNPEFEKLMKGHILSPYKHGTAGGYRSFLEAGLREMKMSSTLMNSSAVKQIREVLLTLEGGKEYVQALDLVVSKYKQKEVGAGSGRVEGGVHKTDMGPADPRVTFPTKPEGGKKLGYGEALAYEQVEKKFGAWSSLRGRSKEGAQETLINSSRAREKLENALYMGMKKDPGLRAELEGFLSGSTLRNMAHPLWQTGREVGHGLVRGLVREAVRRWERDEKLLGRKGEWVQTGTGWRQVRGMSPVGGQKLPFGKFKGKTLEEVATVAPHYIAYLHGNREGFQGVFGGALDLFFEQAWVKAIVRDYTEERGESSPADLRPYRSDYDPETWNSDLYWKEMDRGGGFATSDPWERARRGRSLERGAGGRRYFGKEGEYGVMSHFGPRRGEYRFQEEHDPEYYAAMDLQESMRVLKSKGGSAYRTSAVKLGLKEEREKRYYDDRKGRWVTAKILVDTPLGLALRESEGMKEARMGKRYDEERREWVDEVYYRQRLGYTRWVMNQALRRMQEGEGGIPRAGGEFSQEGYLADLAKFERLQRSQFRVFGGVDPSGYAYQRPGVSYGKRRKGTSWWMDEGGGLQEEMGERGIEEMGEGKGPSYAQQIMEARDVGHLREIAEELEDQYGLENIRGVSPQIDEMVRERLGYLVRMRTAGLAGGSF